MNKCSNDVFSIGLTGCSERKNESPITKEKNKEKKGGRKVRKKTLDSVLVEKKGADVIRCRVADRLANN